MATPDSQFVTSSTPDTSAPSTETLVQQTRRRFGKRLLVGLPLVAAAIMNSKAETVQAGTDGDWTLTGNSLPDNTKFIGSTNAQPLTFKTNNSTRMTITSSGSVGIGTSSPSVKFHVSSSGTTASRVDNSSTVANAVAVHGRITSTAPSAGATAVRGENLGTNSNGYGVYGSHAGTGVGVVGTTAQGTGVEGQHTATTGTQPGVRGVSNSTSNDAAGVVGTITATTAGAGAAGVRGINSATNGLGYGVYGSHASSGYGVFGKAGTGYYAIGVRGEGRDGVSGYATDVEPRGVVGEAIGSNTPIGVYGYAASTDGGASYAGYFGGRVHVYGTLSKSAGSFKIDHPLDPERKYLSHSFVESPDMMNVYNGNVTTDAGGEAIVVLPDYFEALNQDFRYQLTVIGEFAQAIVGREIGDNQFTIKTDKPRVKVSWQVTGIRQDAYAKAHPIVVEEDKPQVEQGTYLHPEVHGQPTNKGVHYKRLHKHRDR